LRRDFGGPARRDVARGDGRGESRKLKGNQEELGVAAPQPNFGISSAKHVPSDAEGAQRPQGSEIKGENDLQTFFTFSHNLSAFAPWREKYPIPIVFRPQIICGGCAREARMNHSSI
jgi:hypothetical protein